jgi:DNA topoisomerase-1
MQPNALSTRSWKRAIASQLADAMFSVNTVKLESLDSDQTFLFKAVGRTLLFPGWKSLTARDAAEEDEPNSSDDETPNGGTVPSLARGSVMTAESGRVLKHLDVVGLKSFIDRANPLHFRRVGLA